MTEDPKPNRLQRHADALEVEIEHHRETEANLRSLLDLQEKRGDDSETLFKLFVESVQDYAIFMLDPRGHVASWNRGAQRIKGYAPQEIIGRHFSTFYPESDIQAGKCEMELEVAGREGRFEDEGWRLRKDGSRFWANVVISAVRGEDGVLIGFSKVTRDLTDRRRAEEERAARIAAEQANQTKDQFMAMLGHELRNPLAPIVTALELIKLQRDEGLTREYEIIERQVRHMMQLLEDLLDVSRVARGKVEIRREPLDMRTVVTKAIEISSPLLEHRRHTLAVELDEALPVTGDEARLTQIISNLLTNAAKYTEPEGEIRVRGVVEGKAVVVSVQDTGTGIAPDFLPHVFDLFAQAYQTPERSAGGLGLGLTLVRQLTGLHGGAVSAASLGEGHGSTFTVELPKAEAAQVAAKARSNPDLAIAEHRRGRRVLLVDDNDDAREMLEMMLSSLGFTVETAADGPAALAVVERFHPEVAVLDIGLPVMDGFELGAQLRARLSPPPRLIALTGYGQKSDRERSAEAGFALHLVKPVDVKRLLAAIDEN